MTSSCDRSSGLPSPMSQTFRRKAWILDVGHGSSIVVEEPNRVLIIDGGQGDTLARFLVGRGIHQVDTVIVSHADADHFGGISLLLSTADFQIGQVFVNPDVRETHLWADFVSVMRSAKQRGTKFNLELTSVNPGSLSFDGVWLEVLGPSQDIAIRTADGRSPDGDKLTPNAMSAVVRVWAGDVPRLLEQRGDVQLQVPKGLVHNWRPGQCGQGRLLLVRGPYRRRDQHGRPPGRTL